MAHSDVRIGKRQIEGVITRRSDEQLGLEKGDKVKVMIIENCDCRVLAAPTTGSGNEVLQVQEVSYFGLTDSATPQPLFEFAIRAG